MTEKIPEWAKNMQSCIDGLTENVTGLTENVTGLHKKVDEISKVVISHTSTLCEITNKFRYVSND